jgi:molecular chaperone GrpE
MAKKEDKAKEETLEEETPSSEEEVQATEEKDTPAEETVEEKLSPLEEKEAEVTALKQEVADLKEQMLRQQADVQNFKRRMSEEKIKERKLANVDLIKALLPIVDNFDLALEKEKGNKDIKKALKGFEMIRRDLMKALKDSGLKEVESLNEPFDPRYHQAVMKEPREGVDSDIVIEEFQKGYMFKDRLVRPAMVKVSE